MSEKNLVWKVLFVVFIVALALLEMWPLDKRLKGGIDLVGGYSFLYEIDTTGIDDPSGLSTRVMERLKQRVDPDGVRNLVWRPVGDTRLEIQMPLPPKETTLARQQFRQAMEALEATNVKELELEQAFALAPEKRAEALEALVRGVQQRRGLLQEAARAYDQWQKTLSENADEETVRDALENYEQSLQQLLETNVDLRRLNEALDLEPGLSERAKALEAIRKQYPQRQSLIAAVERAYDRWSKVKGPLDDPEDLKRLLRGQGVLEFHILPEYETDNPERYVDYEKRLMEQGPRPRADDEFAWYEIAKPDALQGGVRREYNGKWWVLAYYRDPLKVLDKSRKGWKLAEAFPDRDQQNMPAVGFRFNEIGANYFSDLTRNNIGQRLCIILDGKAISAPVIRSAIRARGIITGRFSQEEINYLVNTLNAGSLDARLKDNPISVHSIGPSLGQDNRRAGLRAAMIGLAAVIVFMIIYYLWAGLIADVALLMNLLLLLGAMATLEATFTMAGIAGVILTMGMAVDANVLIYERMREESQRIQSLRMIIKNGYEKALSTILDANVTTLISCVVLYYIGTEEIKGFALTLGLGLVINMFTALFVTRLVFVILAKYNVIKSLPMLKLFGRPNINWVAKQKYFWPCSLIVILVGLAVFPLRGVDKYDIEFRGGTSVQIELKQPGQLGIAEIRDRVKRAGQTLIDSQRPLETATLSANGELADAYTLKFTGIPARRVEAALLTFMEEQLEKGSLQIVDANTISFQVKPELKLTADAVKALIAGTAVEMARTGDQLAKAQVQSIGTEGKRFEIVTTATGQALVIESLVNELGQYLNIQPRIAFNPDIGVYPITHSRLSEVIGETRVAGSLREYFGGAVLVVGQINPPITPQQLRERLVAMRLQPDFEDIQWRDFQVIGLDPAPGQDAANPSAEEKKFTRLAVAVADRNYPYEEDPTLWRRELVEPEQSLLREALSRSTELAKVMQFAPQVARQAKTSAGTALLVAFFGIVMYLWVRFGTIRHGIAAVIALLHDVLVCLAFVMVSAYLAETALGQALGIADFKINLALVAAFLTVIGYSVNDSIVVYDRIRENRGKLAEISPALVNTSINQTLSRTVLTTLTTFMVMLIMFIFGGEGVRGFSYVMLVGTLVGTYSSVAIASPLLLGWMGTLRLSTNRQS